MAEYAIVDPQGTILGTLQLEYGLEIKLKEAAIAPPPAPPRMVERKVMTAAANGYSYEEHIGIGWTDETLVQHGLMTVELVPEDQVAPAAPPAAPVVPAAPEPEAALHPSLANTQLGPQWHPEPETTAATVPGVPTAQVAPTVPVDGVDEEAESPSEYQHAAVPHIEGREFIIRNVSYESVVDKDGVPFDGRIHGVTADNKPALKKDGTFKKRRNLDNTTYEQITAQLKAAVRGQGGVPTTLRVPAAPAPAVPAPSAPSAPAAPAVPTVPTAPGAPAPGGSGTAPPPPADLAELEAAIQDWGEEI